MAAFRADQKHFCDSFSGAAEGGGTLHAALLHFYPHNLEYLNIQIVDFNIQITDLNILNLLNISIIFKIFGIFKIFKRFKIFKSPI